MVLFSGFRGAVARAESLKKTLKHSAGTFFLETGDDLDVYLYRGQWTNDGKEFTYHRLNRLQNRVEIFAADPQTGKTRLLLKDEDPCYIDEQTDLVFLKDNQRFLWTSERSGSR